MEDTMSKRFIAARGARGGYLQGYVNLGYADIVKMFGEPNGIGCDKVSTEWQIKDTRTGKFFRLYDYKETELYDPSLPSVASFRARDVYEWHIGCEDMSPRDVANLEQFFAQKMGRPVKVYAC